MSEAAYMVIGLVLVGGLFIGTATGLVLVVRGAAAGYATLMSFLCLAFFLGLLAFLLLLGETELSRSVLIWLFIIGSAFMGVAAIFLCLAPVRRHMSGRARKPVTSARAAPPRGK
jgi:hypothetical protein